MKKRIWRIKGIIMYEIKKSIEPFTSEVLSEDDLMNFAKEISEDKINDVEDAINVILNDDYYAVYNLDL